MTTPTRTHARHPLATPLWMLAALLTCILGVLLIRFGPVTPAAQAAAPMLPMDADPAVMPDGLAEGGEMYVMPGQIASNLWGVWLLDVERQTLIAYQYTKGARALELIAARDVRYDRQLDDFRNASPTPDDVRRLLEREQNADAGN
jgi:hypothetical protein